MLVAGDVLGDVRAGTLGVAHLAEDAAARAGDAFDGFERSELNGVTYWGQTLLCLGGLGEPARNWVAIRRFKSGYTHISRRLLTKLPSSTFSQSANPPGLCRKISFLSAGLFCLFKMRYDKSHLSIVDQVARLTSRGMEGDPLVMAERLSVANYHRLTAYWYPFRSSDHSFAPGTDFETVWRRYVFDRQLRLLVLDAIERFEVALRTQFSFHHSKLFGPFGYYDSPASLPKLGDLKHAGRARGQAVALGGCN